MKREHSARGLLWSLILIATVLVLGACSPGDGVTDPHPQLSPSPSSPLVALDLQGPEPLPGLPTMTAPTIDATPPTDTETPVTTPIEAESPRIGPETLSGPVGEGQLSAAERAVLYASVPGALEWIPQLEAIGYCESKHSPGAVGDSGASRGWMQIQRLWFDLAGEDWDQAFDPAVNLRVALRIIHYQLDRGQPPFSAWTCAGGW